MAIFRFRVAAALELRRKQEHSAAVTLAQEELRLREARALRSDAETHRQDAQAQEAQCVRAGTDIHTLLWHRNWIVKLTATVDHVSRDAARQADVVRDAERAWHEARRKRLALERLRERAWRRFQDDEQRREMKVIDELARLRHGLAAAEGDEA